MKKLTVFICALLLTLIVPGSLLANPAEKVVFRPGENKYVINGDALTMDATPFITDGRVYVPVRFLAAALGAEDKLTEWDKSTGTVTLVFRGAENKDILLQTGNYQLVINDVETQTGEVLNNKKVSMDVTPVIKDGRVYLPARWVAEACGFAVKWDNDTQGVSIYAPGTEESFAGGASVGTREIESPGSPLELNLQIPVISGMTNKDLQEQINDEILDKAMQIKDELESSYKEYVEDAEEFNYPVHNFVLNVTYSDYTCGDILSLVVETYQYSGGAHGMAWRDYYVLDTRSGRQLALQDLFQDDVDYVSIINKEIKKQIDEQVKSGQGMYFEGDMGFESISENHSFYINDEHIVLCFGQYEIAPYAAGMPEFQLPLDLFSGQWKEDFSDLLL